MYEDVDDKNVQVYITIGDNCTKSFAIMNVATNTGTHQYRHIDNKKKLKDNIGFFDVQQFSCRYPHNCCGHVTLLYI
jgi:hypothetical protein